MAAICIVVAVTLVSCGSDATAGEERTDFEVTWTQDGAYGHLLVAAPTADVREVTVWAFDSSIPGDEVVGAVVWDEATAGCCAVEFENGRLKSLDMRIPLWHPARNRLQIQLVVADDAEAGPFIVERDIQLDPAQLADSGLTEQVTYQDDDRPSWPGVNAIDSVEVTIPLGASTESCRFSSTSDWCQDGDDDGLTDSFEMLLIESTRPRLALHPDDGTLEGADELALFSSTTLMVDDGSLGGYEESGERFVFVPFVIAYERDHGSIFVTEFDDHAGDTEQVKFMWQIVDEGPDVTRLRLHSVFAGAHAVLDAEVPIADVLPGNQIGVTTDPRDMFVADDDRVLLFIELNKHGTWTRADDCELISPFSCPEFGDEYVLLSPPALNIGSPPPFFDLTPRNSVDLASPTFLDGRPFIDFLGDVPGSVHSTNFSLFDGEAVWSEAERQEDVDKFCGGRPPGDGCATQIGDHATRPWVRRVYVGDQLVQLGGGPIPMGQLADDPDEPRVVVRGR